MCDSKLRFLFFAVVSPGSTNDNIAFAQANGLKEFIENLPHGMYALGDAAYTVSDKLLTPFVGSQKNDPNKDAFNFYLSQLRIRIEMSFGLLTNKFRILKRPLEKSLKTNSRILMTCAYLHNFIINHKLGMYNEKDKNGSNLNVIENNNALSQGLNESIDPEDIDIDNYGDCIYGENIQRSMDTPVCMNYYPTLNEDDNYQPTRGISIVRQYIVEVIRENEYRRPEYNKLRNSVRPHLYLSKKGKVCLDYFHPR